MLVFSKGNEILCRLGSLCFGIALQVVVGVDVLCFLIIFQTFPTERCIVVCIVIYLSILKAEIEKDNC